MSDLQNPLPSPGAGTLKFNETVDATGLSCPLPILRAKKALATLSAGDVLRVITTDRGAVRDFQAFCKQTGNTLLAQIDETDRVTHYLERRVK